jgi:hypothetical protein
MRGIVRQITLVLSVVVMLVTNFGFGSNDLSDATVEDTMYNTFMTAVTPASYTFAVWLPIFLGCIALVVYQALPAQRNDPRFDALGWPLTAAFLLNALTPFTPLGISNVVIVLLLLALVVAYRTAVRQQPQDRAFFWFARIPITIFFAWITVATIVNMAQFLTSVGWNGFGLSGPAWSALLIAVATLIGLLVVRANREVSFAIVLVWAFVGIAVANANALPVVLLASLGSLALLGLSIQSLWGRQMQRHEAASS